MDDLSTRDLLIKHHGNKDNQNLRLASFVYRSAASCISVTKSRKLRIVRMRLDCSAWSRQSPKTGNVSKSFSTTWALWGSASKMSKVTATFLLATLPFASMHKVVTT